ncbi:YqgE/AlgH family protein [Nocardioides marinquilinus]|uniref:UPF0301 protein GCM10023340_17480 n=1 Tax=Nocardioides marinquilinus TaxID=1210400 RepID=A0ABP9PNF6_9ACTN
MTEVRAGMLLLATPALLDPNFAGTVVLLVDVNDDGCLGVVLNRPTEVLVAQVLGDWGSVCTAPEVLFSGGPVEKDGALAVALRHSDDEGVLGLRPVADRLAVLDLDTPVEIVGDELDGLRVFAGYAGWGAGQLENEIAREDWYVVPAQPADVFRADTTTLWRDVLRRQPGDLALHSTRPADPELN